LNCIGIGHAGLPGYNTSTSRCRATSSRNFDAFFGDQNLAEHVLLRADQSVDGGHAAARDGGLFA
jgi:hypothetical protein